MIYAVLEWELWQFHAELQQGVESADPRSCGSNSPGTPPLPTLLDVERAPRESRCPRARCSRNVTSAGTFIGRGT